MQSKLGIIIPVYNEAENIALTLTAIEEKVSTPHSIYILYDFEEDTTLPQVKKFSTQSTQIRCVRNLTPGVVNAIKTGLTVAREPCLLVTMADLSDDYSIVDSMCRKMDEGYDIVCASRYMRGGKQLGGPFLKKTLSRLASLSLKVLSGIPTHDVTNSFKLYRKTLIDSITLESSGGFEIGMEIVVKAFLKGYKIAEIPSVWTDRQHGKSRFKLLKWAPNYLKWYFLALRKQP